MSPRDYGGHRQSHRVAVLREGQFARSGGEGAAGDGVLAGSGGAGHQDAAAGDIQAAAGRDYHGGGRIRIETQAVDGEEAGQRAGVAAGVRDVDGRRPGTKGILGRGGGGDDVAIRCIGGVLRKVNAGPVTDRGPASEDGVAADADGVERIGGDAVGGRLRAGGQLKTRRTVIGQRATGDGVEVEDHAAINIIKNDLVGTAAGEGGRWYCLGDSGGSVAVERQCAAAHVQGIR